VADPSCVKRYKARRKTRFEHQWEIAAVDGYVSFPAGEADLVAWLDDRAWTTGDGPRALFDLAEGWLRERRVLLPGATTLIELVATVRHASDDRLFEQLAGTVTTEQARALESILEVPPGQRRSQLDLWRAGERNTTGRGMVKALRRVAEIAALGMTKVDVSLVPTRRLIELARYGIAAKAPKLARHPPARRVATLLATVRWLEVTATDDALELFDVFMANELIGRAAGQVDKDRLRSHRAIVGDAMVLRTAVAVLFDALVWGGQHTPLSSVWAAVDEAVGSRVRLRDAMDRVGELAEPDDAGADGAWRAAVVDRYATVRGFVQMLCQVIAFDATADGRPVLTAMAALGGHLDARPNVRVPRGYLDERHVNLQIVPAGWWQRLVFPADRPQGTVDRDAYVFCVLELFHNGLRRRDIFAVVSDRCVGVQVIPQLAGSAFG
jgi:hypothetical protein